MRPLLSFLLFFMLAYAQLPSEERGWIEADFLYWKAHEKSLVLTNKTSPVFYQPPAGILPYPNQYDLVWLLPFPAPVPPVVVTPILQELLFGDSTTFP
jgi:hypothetical protein